MTKSFFELDGRRYAARAVVDALEPHLLTERFGRMRYAADRRLASLALGVEDLYKGYNGSACLRTAEALGVQDVVAAELRHEYPLPEADPDGRVSRKVSTSAHHWIDLHRTRTASELMAWARAREMRVFGAGPRATLALEELPTDGPLMVLFGNERDGLQDETAAACEACFRIPMHGFTESFNVSVSVGIVLAALSRRVRARLEAEGRLGDLPEERYWSLLARWCVRDVRGAAAIVRRKLNPADR